MNMLSMRRTSNLGGFDNTLAQCGEASVQAQESSQASSVKQSDKAERMSIEMEDKDTSVKKKQARAPVISVSSDSSDVEDSDQEEEGLAEEEGCSDDEEDNSSQEDGNDTE